MDKDAQRLIEGARKAADSLMEYWGWSCQEKWAEVADALENSEKAREALCEQLDEAYKMGYNDAIVDMASEAGVYYDE